MKWDEPTVKRHEPDVKAAGACREVATDLVQRRRKQAATARTAGTSRYEGGTKLAQTRHEIAATVTAGTRECPWGQLGQFYGAKWSWGRWSGRVARA